MYNNNSHLQVENWRVICFVEICEVGLFLMSF